MARLLPLHGGSTAVGLLAVRIVAGSAMAFHGWPKMRNPMGWMGPEVPVPGLLQACAAVAEFGGGICWVLGLMTPIAALLILATMATAAGMVHIPAGHPFVSKSPPSWELAAVYLSISLLLLLAGPGKLSLDALFFGRRERPERV